MAGKGGQHPETEENPKDAVYVRDTGRFLHELEVHQIELEQQNEELRAAQEALEQARDEYHDLYDEYRDLYDSAPIGYLTLNKKAEITALNATACRILGGFHDTLIGELLYRFIPRDERDILYRHLQEVFAARRTRTCEFSLQPFSQQKPIRVHLESIVGEKWKSDRILVALSDITEQDELKHKLRDTERLVAIGAASATLAHELGNPLNNILIAFQAMGRQLARSKSERDPIRANTDQIEREIARLSHLVDEVRQLTAPPKLHTESIGVDVLLGTVLRIAENTLKQRRIRVEKEIHTRCTILGDHGKLCQAFLNLVKNAIEATPLDNRAVALRAYGVNSWICIEIANSGEPIPLMLDVFEPFVTSKGHGIGLGLTIVNQIVSAHGGIITYTSSAEETMFRVMLPKAEEGDHRTTGPPDHET